MESYEPFWRKLFYVTGCIFELARGVIIFAVIVGLLTTFVGTVNVVNGPSMEPNFHNGQYLLVDKLSYNLRDPRRGEAVILKFPGDPEKMRYIKRLMGLPGDKLAIKSSKLYINGQEVNEDYIPTHYLTRPDMEITIPSGEYFVMGDNRENSNDSRVFKTVEHRFLIGLAYVVIFPFSDIELVPPQFYMIDRTGV